MNKTDPDTMRVVLNAEYRMREDLIERAATYGLTPDEVQRAMTIDRNWKADGDGVTDLQESKA